MPFTSFCHAKQLCEFTVLEVEKEGRNAGSSKFCQADVYVMRNHESMGSDGQYHCRTHLGHLLSAGDTVLGVDFTTANLNDDNLEKMSNEKMPDVVIVKKSFGDKKKRSRSRNWKLKKLAIEQEEVKEKDDEDYDDFLEDLEEDVEFRKNVNIYRDRTKMVAEGATEDDLPVIALEEMLDELDLEDQPMESDED